MEEALASINVGINTNGGAYFYQGQSFEELKQLLVCASMELKSQREASKAQENLLQVRVRHLEELLKTSRRERDEYREHCVHLTGMLSSAVGPTSFSQEPQKRSRAGVQPLETVSSMTSSISEPMRKSIVSEVNKRVAQQAEYVSSMTEPTRDTLKEVHRKMKEQQQFEMIKSEQQQITSDVHQILQRQHSSHTLDLRPTPQQHQKLEELRQHFEIQQKDHLPDEQLHIEMVINDRQAEVTHSGDVANGNDAKGSTWNEFSPGVHMDIHSSNEQRMILDSPERMHMKLTQGLPTPHVDQRSSPHLDDLQQQLQQQQHLQQQQQQLQQQQQQQLQQQQQQQHHQQHQHPQDDDIQMHLHQQHQESEEILSHMQQGQQTVDSHGLHLPDSKKFRRQLSKHQDLDVLVPISGGLQGANDGVMNLSVLQQHPNGFSNMHLQQHLGLNGFTSSPLSNGSNGISEQLLQNSCLQGGSVVASILSPLERFVDPTSSSVLLSRPVHHLPEPPEADPQVILNSLPEKGKLLQAVVNAGPLLQSLLLAGPLPQWRHPPPPLDAEEIPRVSMGAAVGVMPPGEQGIPLMSNHGSLEQVMRLTTSVQSSPQQNGFCH